MLEVQPTAMDSPAVGTPGAAGAAAKAAYALRVFVRVRPPLPHEPSDVALGVSGVQPDGTQVVSVHPDSRSDGRRAKDAKAFAFDGVFATSSTQDVVYSRAVEPQVTACRKASSPTRTLALTLALELAAALALALVPNLALTLSRSRRASRASTRRSSATGQAAAASRSRVTARRARRGRAATPPLRAGAARSRRASSHARRSSSSVRSRRAAC